MGVSPRAPNKRSFFLDQTTSNCKRLLEEDGRYYLSSKAFRRRAATMVVATLMLLCCREAFLLLVLPSIPLSPTIPQSTSQPPPRPGNDWKDEWMENWVRRQGSTSLSNLTCEGEERCFLPKYLPPRLHDLGPPRSRIPKVLFQTWKSNEVAPKMFEAVMSFLSLNPEYEYVLFDDRDAVEFMCRFSPDDGTKVAYELHKYGACRADLWRMLMIHHYGGVYTDIDSSPVQPFRDFIHDDADMVSVGKQVKNKNRLHFTFLAFSPSHPIMEQALARAVVNTLDTHGQGQYVKCLKLTGPNMYAEVVSPVLKAEGCWKEGGGSELLITCPDRTPTLGKALIYDNERKPRFRVKDWGVDEERGHGEERYQKGREYSDMFHTDHGRLCRDVVLP